MKKQEVLKKLINHILFLLNIIVALSLLIAYLGTHISPAVFWPFAFFGLSFPYLLAVNILFLFYWIFLWKKWVLIPLIVIILGFNHIKYTLPVFRSKTETSQKKGNDLKVLSYNVRAFNLYDWLNDPNTNKGILNFIRSEHPDVICLQEFYSGRVLEQPSINYIRLFGEHPYKHIEYTSKEKHSGHGIATLSKYPIVRKGVIPFKNSRNVTIYTDILFKGDTIRIYNNHLQSVRFREQNYRMLDSLKIGRNHPEMEEIKDISSKIKNAYIQRADQTDLVKAHLKNSPYPVIICGDFNDTPVSYTYNKLRKGMNDAFIKAGKGRGNTYNGKPPLRIDYILYSSEFEAISFEKVEAVLSDHFPIIAVLRK